MKDSTGNNTLSRLYGSSLALLTDLYELTMAYGYWKTGMADTEAMFTLFFREQPFKGGYTIACGLRQIIDFISSFRFDKSDIEYLGGLETADGAVLFEQPFLDYLGGMHLCCDIDAVPEGTILFPFEPVLRIRGPLIQCQILESALLNILNFQTLIATKAARVCHAAQGDPVLEFGLRRAQGIDGSIMASRAAYVGGCAGTSNVLAGKLFDIPVKGTHAHSWVMAFDTEPDAFGAYADAMPHNTIFLVDTYDSMQGVRNAVDAGRMLKERGYKLTGVRLDSGDLAVLSKEARNILDDAGFDDTVIVGSSDLDEYAISRLKKEDAPIAVWGVGTKLVTGWDSPALSGVYKLSAIRRRGGPWKYRMKVSDEQIKSTIPGILQVRRFESDGRFLGDCIFDEDTGTGADSDMIDMKDWNTRIPIPESTTSYDLLQPVFQQGILSYQCPDIQEIRKHAKHQMDLLDDSVKRFQKPNQYTVGIETRLFGLRQRLIRDMSERK